MNGFFSISEFGRLCNITRDTLIYYDKIGLLEPSFIASNGYRYYSFRQYESLRMISTMKLFGLSLLEIKKYQKKRNPDTLLSIMDSIEDDIDNQINRLKSIKKTLKYEKYEMKNAIANLNTFIIEDLQEQPYICIKSDIYNNDTFTSALCKLDEVKKNNGLTKSYSIGVYGLFDHMNKRNSDQKPKVINFDGIYMLLIKKNKNCHIRKKGKYLVIYIYTDFKKDEVDLFNRVLEYVKDNNIVLSNEYYQESYGGSFKEKEDFLFLAKYMFKIKESTNDIRK